MLPVRPRGPLRRRGWSAQRSTPWDRCCTEAWTRKRREKRSCRRSSEWGWSRRRSWRLPCRPNAAFSRYDTASDQTLRGISQVGIVPTTADICAGTGICEGGKERPSPRGHRSQAQPAKGDRTSPGGLGEEDEGHGGDLRAPEGRAGERAAAASLWQRLRGRASPSQILCSGERDHSDTLPLFNLRIEHALSIKNRRLVCRSRNCTCSCSRRKPTASSSDKSCSRRGRLARVWRASSRTCRPSWPCRPRTARPERPRTPRRTPTDRPHNTPTHPKVAHSERWRKGVNQRSV